MRKTLFFLLLSCAAWASSLLVDPSTPESALRRSGGEVEDMVRHIILNFKWIFALIPAFFTTYMIVRQWNSIVELEESGQQLNTVQRASRLFIAGIAALLISYVTYGTAGLVLWGDTFHMAWDILVVMEWEEWLTGPARN